MSEEIKDILNKFDKVLENYELDKKFKQFSVDSICHLFPYEMLTIKNTIKYLQQKVERLEKENKILKENAEHNDQVVDKVNWENMVLKGKLKDLKERTSMNRELLQLIKENPDLQVYAYVDYEIVGGDCGYWMGEFGRAEIKEYATVEPYGWNDMNIVYKDEQEDYIEYLMENNVDDALDNEELEKWAKRITENLDYKKAIFVYVELPKY